MVAFSSWRRHSLGVSPASTSIPARFDAAQAVVVSSPGELADMKPGFVRSLSSQFNVDALAARLCPVLLSDQTVAVFALAEHVGSDQADELAHLIVKSGQVLASPSRYVLAAPLLLAIARKQITAQTLASQPLVHLAQSKTALADAFHDLVEWGVRNGASDLHVNVCLREPESEVKYTISGRYVSPERFRRMPTGLLVDMLSVAWMDIGGGNGAVFDPTIEQQGSLIRQVEGRDIMLRWASLSSERGPSVCLRLLKREGCAQLPTLEQLGYLPDQIAQIKRVMVSEGGAIVFAGTVGSGKSTTLASLIAALPSHRKVITIEDPVEYLIPDAIQNTVARNLDKTAHQDYAAKLRALKRSAMSDVLLGEIRDQETARAFMDLAGSGVNVYTTVHAPCATQVPERLASDFIGVSRDFLAAPGMLKLLVCQALLPTLCPHCSLPAQALAAGVVDHEASHRTAAQWRCWLCLIEELYGLPTMSFRIRNSQGCPACIKPHVPELNGYTGRTVVAELIEPALWPEFLQGIRRGAYAALERAPVLNPHSKNDSISMRTSMECAVAKASHGLIDPRDIELRFRAFETERLLRDLHPGPRPSRPQLRAVP
ncbi:general secretion pathway protein [Pollutimonas nitritireducens]|uniref:General secretion pathway protein n=1 Tax=Pollutimonas nitritireducens TaxID=2045209 RepID=A0A2N4UIU6_9BURK|nr:ATPase, T2SS/T4P/T4SS family [Pollutimonas nitritireducens]PLC54895.1 general secretion pathway protein [Pollutimonas nitritireducens]